MSNSTTTSISPNGLYHPRPGSSPGFSQPNAGPSFSTRPPLEGQVPPFYGRRKGGLAGRACFMGSRGAKARVPRPERGPLPSARPCPLQLGPLRRLDLQGSPNGISTGSELNWESKPNEECVGASPSICPSPCLKGRPGKPVPGGSPRLTGPLSPNPEGPA